MAFFLRSITLATLFVSLTALANAQEPKPEMASEVEQTKTSAPVAPAQEYYELRTYKITDIDNQEKVERYLADALLPALNRMNVDRVGVFTSTSDVNDHSIYMLIPYKDLATFTGMNTTLAADAVYQEAAKSYFDQPKKKPLYKRIESRFMKAFESMPVIEQPAQTANKEPRIFELRLYQSHTEDHARRKVQMFNTGETQLMRDCEMAPVFFGETLIGPEAPNLIYMLSASDDKAHKAHWQKFLKGDRWAKMKVLPEYKDTVSKIKNWFLVPTAYSQL